MESICGTLFGSFSISVLVFLGGGRRVPRENAGLQEFESRSSVHLPLDGFEAVDVTLHRPVVPAARDGQRDSKERIRTALGLRPQLAHERNSEFQRASDALNRLLTLINCDVWLLRVPD